MKYQYSGPTSGVTLREGDDNQEIMLYPGTKVELPEAHEYTAILLAMGYLAPPPAEPAPPAHPGAADEQQKAASDAAAKGV